MCICVCTCISECILLIDVWLFVDLTVDRSEKEWQIRVKKMWKAIPPELSGCVKLRAFVYIVRSLLKENNCFVKANTVTLRLTHENSKLRFENRKSRESKIENNYRIIPPGHHICEVLRPGMRIWPLSG